eukprot:gene53246-71189_t
MPTDPARVRRTDPGDPDKCPVWQFHQVYSDTVTKEWVVKGCKSAGIGCLECKQPVIDAILKEQEPMRERAQQYLDDPSLVRAIVADGCDVARKHAQDTMRDIAEPASASPVLSAQPSGWVGRFAGLMPAGLVLDLACGSGRHVPLITGLGHPLLAVDRDLAALAIIQAAGHAALQTLQFDLESEQAAQHPDWPFAPARFAGIVVTNYLHRPLFDAMLASLAPGGVLIAETFADGNGLFGKPSNPAFLLQPGELLALAQRASDLRVLAFED